MSDDKPKVTYSSPRIEKHPDYAEIVQRMCSGEGVKSIDKWLKARYPNKKKNQVSWVTLQKFRKYNLNISGTVLKDLKEKKNAELRRRRAEETKALVESTSAYQDKLHEVADGIIDVPKKIIHMSSLVDARIEKYFNMVSAMDNDDTIREDRLLIELVEKQRGLYTDWKKLIESFSMPEDEVSLNSTVVHEQLFKIKEAIRRVIDKMDPDLAIQFTESLCEELDNLEIVKDEINFESLSRRANGAIVDVGFEENN